MSFTKEELEAAGWPPLGGYNYYFEDDEAEFWDALQDGNGKNCPNEYRDGLLRLAIAHPERAHLALGDGWKIQNADTRGIERILWCGKWDGGQAHILMDRGGVYGIETYGAPIPEQPLVPALQRAYRIFYAWQRIQQQEDAK